MKYNINNMDMFSKYYMKDSEIYSKKTNNKLKKDKYNSVSMCDDNGKSKRVQIKTLTQHNINTPPKIKDLKNEVWKPIVNNIGNKFNYSISNLGRVKTNGNYYTFECLNTEWIDRDGYITVKVNSKRHMVHRLIYEYFIGNIPKGYHIHHIDGNKQNNSIDNLECISPSEHNKRHHKDNTFNRYTRGYVLTDEERKAIASKHKPYKYTIPMLAKEYNISESTVERIIKKYKKD